MIRHSERWLLLERFVISRASKSAADVIVVEISNGTATGRGECVPYARYGETLQSVCDSLAPFLRGGTVPNRQHLQDLLPAGAARNAVDCALWDFEAKCSQRSVASLAQLPPPRALTTAYTLSLASPDEMAAKAIAALQYPLLKLKLGAPEDASRMRAVRAARCDARLIVDANEAWQANQIETLFDVAAQSGIELIEQPLPADQDGALATCRHPVPICADESAHVSTDLAALRDRYDAVNIKLDKTGGLTEALAMTSKAASLGLKIMVGCMVSTSLAMAPAMLVAQKADWVDLDGPLLLAADRQPGLRYDGAIINPPPPELWG